MTNVVTGEEQRDPLGSGVRFDVVRTIVTALVAGLVAYFTSMTAIDQRVTTVETRESTHFEELQRTLGEMRTDMREIRNDVKTAVSQGKR